MSVFKEITNAVTKTRTYAKAIAKAKYHGTSEARTEEYQQQLEDSIVEYCHSLRRDIEQVTAKSTTYITGVSVDLMDTFVDMDFSFSQQLGDDLHNPKWGKQGSKEWKDEDRDQTPEMGLSYAKAHSRVFVIVGEPGSGKTTLLQYYALKCLEGDYSAMGFSKWPIPVFYRLRELDFDNETPVDLPSALEKWKEGKGKSIDKKIFEDWLSDHSVLVMLDGLDEIRELSRRRKICTWLHDMQCGARGEEVLFVLTSRETGFRKRDDVELSCNYVRADLCGFNWKQQQKFINKWFDNAFLKNENRGVLITGEEKLKNEAKLYANELIKYLGDKKNKVIRKLTATPVILQITAMLYKHKGVEFTSRSQLYVAALDYLLEGRDKNKQLEKFQLQTSDTLAIMQTLAVYMQNDIKNDAIVIEKANELFTLELKSIGKNISVREFAQYIVHWGALLTEMNEGRDYVFYHKTFREYLVAVFMYSRLFEENNGCRVVDVLIEEFDDSWWEEVILFLMDMCDGERFNKFWQNFFDYYHNKKLSKPQEEKILGFIGAASRCKVPYFTGQLLDKELLDERKLLIVNCLAKIDKPIAYEAILEYVETCYSLENKSLSFIRGLEILRTHTNFEPAVMEKNQIQQDGLDKFIYNLYEYDAEYILIPGGTYHDKSKGGLGKQQVDDIYFAKYSVTNRQYNQFITFLAEESDYKTLSYQVFRDKLLEFSRTVEGNCKPLYEEYLDKGKWSELFRSNYSENKKFNADEQPVVGISWYAARAYTFWLSCLTFSEQGDLDLLSVEKLAGVFRLPEEKEWLWAAGRSENSGKLKKYPWCSEEKPNEELANFGKNIGKTTVVGSYPKGATVDGLMDIAGNVWEWQGNWIDSDEKYRALRGGSWGSSAGYLPCSARLDFVPVYWFDDVGFRVVRQSLLKL